MVDANRKKSAEVWTLLGKKVPTFRRYQNCLTTQCKLYAENIRWILLAEAMETPACDRRTDIGYIGLYTALWICAEY